MEPLEVIEYRGFLIKILPDEMPSDGPRSWDNLGTMVCFHSRYTLGDKHNFKDQEDLKYQLCMTVAPIVTDAVLDYWNNTGYVLVSQRSSNPVKDPVAYVDKKIDEFLNRIIDKYYITLPLYLYDHSGITMNTIGFSCPWDSGQVGIIYAPEQTALEECGSLEKALQYLKNEVEVYDQYLTGDIYGIKVEPKENNQVEYEDSCWGYYGYDYTLETIVPSFKEDIDQAIVDYKDNALATVRDDRKRRAGIQRLMASSWAY